MRKLIILFIMILSFSSCTIVGREGTKTATSFIAKKQLKKQAAKTEARMVQSKVERKVVKELTVREAKKKLLYLQNHGFGNLQLTQEIVQKLYKFGADNNLTENEVNTILSEIQTHYAGDLVKEYNSLSRISRNKVLTGSERRTFEEIGAKMVGKDNRYAASEIEQHIDDMIDIGYHSSEMVTTKAYAHAVVRHARKGPKKSAFNEDFRKNMFTEIESLGTDPNALTGVQKTGRIQKTRHYENAIGTSDRGEPLYDMVVILEKDGRLVTAYPAEKEYIEKHILN